MNFLLSRGLFTFLCFVSIYSSAQTQDERKEYYKNMMANAETIVKTFNIQKQEVQAKIFNNEHDGYANRSEFQCAYEIYLIDFFSKVELYDAEFKKKNNFQTVPEMSYLKNLNALLEKKLSLLKEGINFFESISTEISTKSFKRWNISVIDQFVSNSKESYNLYIKLRPICYEIYLLSSIHENVSYLNCTYNNWDFMLKNKFNHIATINPLGNFNMLSHIFGFTNRTNNDVYDIVNSNFDYTKITFANYTDYKFITAWIDSSAVKNPTRDAAELYGDEIANSNSALLIAFLIKSLEFESSNLSELFRNCNLPIRKCTYDNNDGVFSYYNHDFASTVELVKNDSVVAFIQSKKESINSLYSIIPNESPWFYNDCNSKQLEKNIRNFDEIWYIVYQLKKDLILASCYLKSIKNDLDFNEMNSSLLTDWYNIEMEASKFKAYYKNEYMVTLQKTNSKVWESDYQQLQILLQNLRLLKNVINDDFVAFELSYENLKSSEDLKLLLKTIRNEKFKIFDERIIQGNSNEIAYQKLIYKLKSEKLSAEEFNSLGWRCLTNKQFVYAEKYLRDGLNVESGNTMISLNLAHVLLLTGEREKAMEIYKKYSMVQEIPALKTTVGKWIVMDFNEFISLGIEPAIFDPIKSELGL